MSGLLILAAVDARDGDRTILPMLSNVYYAHGKGDIDEAFNLIKLIWTSRNPTVSKNQTDHKHLWTTLAKAFGTELRNGDSITGASGLIHPLQALCVDDKNKRLILFSNEPDARVAALVQGDVQATMPDAKVLVARPAVYDLSALIRGFYENAATAMLSFTEIKGYADAFNALPDAEKQRQAKEGGLVGKLSIAGQMIKAMQHVPLPALTHASNLVQQAMLINWGEVIESLKEGGKEDGRFTDISLANIYNYDSIAVDREYGVCPVPLYQFTEKDWELFLDGRHIDDVRERLRALNIYQYFFPPPDQLALGIAERGIVKREEITEIVASAPSQGHPFGENEIIPTSASIRTIIDQLSESNYVSEIDHAVTLTKEGTTTRTKIKATPREGALAKLINRFKVNLRLSTKDLWPK